MVSNNHLARLFSYGLLDIGNVPSGVPDYEIFILITKQTQGKPINLTTKKEDNHPSMDDVRDN